MLVPGKRLGGTLEILGPLGAGGMGEVYRARDTKLGREVAVKVLPQELAGDADRLARFEHEARTASSLNHPNIVTLHDIGRDGSTLYQVLELIHGRTLREMLSKGALPVRIALQIADQLAAGLAAAHTAQIVHRDLKPENIMVRDDGVVKILDFGLAKLQPGAGRIASHLQTQTAVTSPGAILGTVGYMSPEQARGDAVDFRSDQFALGSVVYEMLSGQRPFVGDSAAQTLTAIIEREPEPLARNRADIPRPLSWVLERCLAKAPRDRYASTLDLARDLRNIREHLSEISHVASVAAPPPRRLSRGVFAASCGALGLVVGLLVGLVGLRRAPAPVEPPKLSTITFSGHDYLPSVSADGRMIAFVSLREEIPRIWLKSMVDGSEAPLTSGPDYRPRISPDGSSVLFARDEGSGSALYRIATLGGEPRKLLDDANEGDWSPTGDRIVFIRSSSVDGKSTTAIGLARTDGGGEQIVGTVDDAAVSSPRWSPDGAWIAVSLSQFGASESAAKYIHLVRADGSESRDLRSPVAGGEVTGVSWLGRGDEILYSQGESVTTITLGGGVINAGASRVYRQRIDSGEARVVLWTPTLSTVVEVAGSGRLVLDAVMARQNLQEYDLTGSGKATGVFISQGASLDRQPVYSPDGEWVAFSSNRSGNLDIWARSLRSGELRRLTDHPSDDWDPAFTRDGRQLIWTSRRGGNFEIWMANADGTGARQVSHDGFDAENASPTPDGQWLVYNSANPQKSGLWKIRTDGSEATHLVRGTCAWPEVSPDGRYVSYTVPAETGVNEVRVVRFPDGEPLGFRIELPGTERPNGRNRWMPDGRSIAFNWNQAKQSGIFAQDFSPGSDTRASRRALVLIEPGGFAETFGISPDGKRLTLATSHRSFGLLSAENVPGIEPPVRRGR